MKRFLNSVFIFMLLFVVSNVTAASEITQSQKQIAKYIKAKLTLQSGGMLKSVYSTTLQEKTEQTGRISGTISGVSADMPYGNVFVEAICADSLENSDDPANPKGLAVVNEDGTFLIEGLAEGHYIVVAWADGYELLYYNNTTNRGDAELVFVREGVETSGIDFNMTPVVPGSGIISGRVVNNADLHPIGHAFVLVSSPTLLDRYGWAQVDQDGYYEITGLKSGDYLAVARADGFLEQYYDNAASRSDALLISVTDSQQVENIDFSLKMGGSISGTVIDSEGNPVFESAVYVMMAFQDSIFNENGDLKPGGYYDYAKAVTDENGYYIISGLVPGEYIVRAAIWDRYGYEEKWYDDVLTWEEATPVSVQEEQNVTGIDFTMSLKISNGLISGRVINAYSNPVENANIQVRSVYTGDNSQRVWSYAKTDSQGFYAVRELPDDEYYVSVYAQNGWQSVQQWWPGVDDMASATPVSIVNGRTEQPIDFQLPIVPGTAILSGTVRKMDGTPISSANIQVSPAEEKQTPGLNVWAWASTDSNGFYQVSKLPAGDYVVAASKWESENFGQQWYDHADSLSLATVVTLGAREHEPNINFDFDPRPMYGSIAGMVSDSLTGTAIDRAFIEVKPVYASRWYMYPGFAAWSFYDITDENGLFSIDYLWEGEYYITVHANGSFEYYNDAVVESMAQPVKVTGGEKSEIDFSLVKRNDGTGSISGNVLSEWDDTPFEIAIVTAKPAVTIAQWPYSELYYTAVTAVDGSYKLEGLPPGEYLVKGSSYFAISEYYDNVFDPAEAELVQVAENITTENINFMISPAYWLFLDYGYSEKSETMISGNISDSDGNPLPQANIYVFDQAGQAIFSCQANAQGNYQVNGLPPGNYVLQVTKEGFSSLFNGNVSVLEQAVPIELNGMVNINFTLPAIGSTPVSDEDKSSLPKSVTLLGNYPNPFNPETMITFSIPEMMDVTLKVYNISGELVKVLADGPVSFGMHRVTWDGRNSAGQLVTSGLYFYRLSSPKGVYVGKMVLVH